MTVALLDARLDLYERVWPSRDYIDYVRAHQLDMTLIGGFAGPCAVLPIADCGGGRFDFMDDKDTFVAFVCEAYDADGETVIDLVAWPVDRPARVMSMFGCCGMLGAWWAMNPATYFMGAPLVIHKTPLDWLKAGCRGAAVVTPHLAARMFLDLPGKLVEAQDSAHGRELAALEASGLDPIRFVMRRRAA